MGMAKCRPSCLNLQYINCVAGMTTHANPCGAATTWMDFIEALNVCALQKSMFAGGKEFFVLSILL